MIESASVAFHTLGCKLNFAETSTLARQLKAAGFSKKEFDQSPDLFVINTCSVTENADKECRQLVRKALQSNPDGFVVVVGCYAQLKPEEIASMEGVDLVLGAQEKFNLPHFLGDLQKKKQGEVHACEIDQVKTFKSSYSLGDRTRAFLKVQDGCDYTCSYCTIPLARGASRSDTIENIITQAREIAAEGIREIVLTGVNIGDYGLIQGDSRRPYRFLDLIKRLDEVEGIDRFRISSIEPNLLDNDIIEFVAKSKRFVPHFHIPLQSGSDRILKLMRRRYLTDLYTDRIASIRRHIPEASIGVDVIVGFPTESDSDFQDTYRFLQELDISYLHVFTYSERDDTDAPMLSPSVPIAIRKQRNKMLRVLSAKKQHAFYERFTGTRRTVLFESEVTDGCMSGYTDNYLRVRLPADPQLINRLVPVSLEKLDERGLFIGSAELEPVSVTA